MTVKERKTKIEEKPVDEKKRGQPMRKRRFLALAAALAVGMTLLSAPMAAFATEPGDDYEDISGDEPEEGEQTTIPAPDEDDGPDSGGSQGGSSSGGSSGGGNGGGSGSPSQGQSGGTGAAASSSDSSLASLGISPGLSCARI